MISLPDLPYFIIETRRGFSKKKKKKKLIKMVLVLERLFWGIDRTRSELGLQQYFYRQRDSNVFRSICQRYSITGCTDLKRLFTQGILFKRQTKRYWCSDYSLLKRSKELLK